MWTSVEDGERYRELTRAIEAVLIRQAGPRSLEKVQPEDLAFYLEWLELAREAAPCLRPFIDKSSPFGLGQLSLYQMTRDFCWLRTQISDARSDFAGTL